MSECMRKLLFCVVAAVTFILVASCSNEEGLISSLPTKYTVSFDLLCHGDSVPESIIVAPGSIIEAPVNPISNDGYTCRGWYIDKSCLHQWRFDVDRVMDNITLYAKWVATINGYDCVKLAGKYWATENADSIEGVEYVKYDYGHCYYTQKNALLAAQGWNENSADSLKWTLPSIDNHWETLLNHDNCTWIWRYDDYNSGYFVTGKLEDEIGHTIFLPVTGVCNDEYELVSSWNKSGYYWSTFDSNCIFFNQGGYRVRYEDSTRGMAVRPVAE